jgi:hypothetical protein
MPLLGAGGAQAADAETWDRVAACESGGLWSADTGNGFFGGLQFTHQMWKDYGGREYAPRADLASRAQQITVAERMLAAEGPEAWPSCAVNAGLTDRGAPADVDPGRALTPGPSDGSTPTDDPAQSGRASDGAGEPGSFGRADTAGPDAEEPGRARSGPGAPSDSAGESTGRHRGDPAEAGGQPGAVDDDERGSARHVSRDGGAGRTEHPAAGAYTVRPGDSLTAIADEHALSGGWSALYEGNEKLVGGDPDLIMPGQRLDLRDTQE